MGSFFQCQTSNCLLQQEKMVKELQISSQQFLAAFFWGKLQSLLLFYFCLGLIVVCLNFLWVESDRNAYSFFVACGYIIMTDSSSM